VQDNEYNPATVNITTGTTVVWTWASGNYNQHSVTFNDGVTSSTSKMSGTHSRTFQSAGTFSYYCDVHGTTMAGSVVVTAP
jgi:plastocyanin